ncbi:flavodoxin [bacterium]|nr:flavodoxin [bacterium]
MKKLGLVIIILGVVVALGWWWQRSKIKEKEVEITEPVVTTGLSEEIKEKGETMTADKTAVIYFSATGNTKKAAEMAAAITGGDLIEIVPVEEYTQADLNWHDEQSRSSKEMKDEMARPVIRPIDDLSVYSRVILGSPIWWGLCPRVINSMIESSDLADKEIHLLITSGSSGVEEALETLKKQYPALNIVDGKRYNGGGKEELAAWLTK